MLKSRTIYPRLLAAMQAHPELGQYKRFLTGGCCRGPSDDRIRPKLRGFMAKYPRWESVLRPLVEDSIG